MRTNLGGKWARRGLAALVLAAAALIAVQVRSGLFGGPSKEDVAATVAGNNDFAFDLFARLKKADGNLIFSPYSISSALAMTWAGARNQTEKQMASVLHFTLPQVKLHPAQASITNDLNERGGKGKYELVVANRLWGQKGAKFLDPFLDLNKEFYGAGFETVDFEGAPEEARKKINDWAADKTRGKIKEPVPPGALGGGVMLALANAIYFKGMWASQFDKDNTQDAPFHLAAGDAVDVPMMYQKALFRWGGRDGARFLEMPYVGDELSMVVLLPDEAGGLPGLEAKLGSEWLEGLLAAGNAAEVMVYLPRFKMEWGTDLAKVLPAMGMSDAFGGAADFSGMTGAPGLFISNVIHKAMVDVNEEGTEAAAVTVVLMKPTSVEPQNIFRADRPFLFLIRDMKTGSVLFIGRVMDPRAK